MSVFSDVRSASRVRLLASASVPDDQIAWEGVFFTPTPGTPYISEVIKPGPVKIAVAGGVEATTEFSLNYTIHCPSGGGTRPLELIADAIHSAFRPGQWLSYGAHRASIQKCTRTEIRPEADWMSCTVTAVVMAHTFEG